MNPFRLIGAMVCSAIFTGLCLIGTFSWQYLTNQVTSPEKANAVQYPLIITIPRIPETRKPVITPIEPTIPESRNPKPPNVETKNSGSSGSVTQDSVTQDSVAQTSVVQTTVPRNPNPETPKPKPKDPADMCPDGFSMKLVTLNSPGGHINVQLCIEI